MKYGSSRTWSLRLIAIWTTAVTVLAAVAGVAANLKTIREFGLSFFAKETPGKLSIRDARGTRTEEHGWEPGNPNVYVSLSFVIEKSGDKGITDCQGQILLPGTPLVFTSKKGQFQIERGEVQRQQRIEITVPKEYYEGAAKVRVECSNLVTPFTDVSLPKIVMEPFPPL